MKIKKKSIADFVITLPIFRPMCMTFFPLISDFYFWLSIFLLGYLALDIINCRMHLSLMTKLIVIIEILVFISTLLCNGSLRNSVGSVVLLSYIALLINWYVEKKESCDMIRAMMLHLELCTYINLVTLFIKPNGFFRRSNVAYGLTREWFLGSDHYFVVWAIPAFLVAWYFKEYTGDKRRSFFLIVMACVTQLIRGSTTGLVGVAIFVIWLIFPFIREVMTPFRCVIAVAVLLVSIVLLQQSDFLEPIIVGILRKDMTYTNRLEIWDNAIEAILNRPIAGYGSLYNDQVVDLLGRLRNGFRWEGAVHCHCQYLQVGLKSGITGIVLYVWAIVLAFIKANECEIRTLAQVSMVCMFIFCIISITEVYEYPQMYMLFIIPFYLTEIRLQIITQQKNAFGG